MPYVPKVILMLVPALLLGSAELPLAQPPAGGPPEHRYDPTTVETVRGEVTAVDTVVQGRRGPGVHVKLATASGPLAVRLGPAWYLEEQKLAPKVRDVLEVTGSRVTVAGEPVIIAAQVKQGDRTVMLRDASGVPLWRGRGGQGRCSDSGRVHSSPRSPTAFRSCAWRTMGELRAAGRRPLGIEPGGLDG